MTRVSAKVVEIKGFCPVYQEGDELVFEDFVIRSKESCNICMHALSAISQFLWAMAHGHSIEELGIGRGRAGLLKCPDPGPPHTTGGSVLFQVEVLE